MMCATLFLQSMSYFREFFVFLRQINSRIMTKLSVNINKIATLRNARGGNVPDVVKVALDCESFGADGITVHPRPDERHIRHSDVYALRPLLRTEFNIEGYPSPEFIDLVLKVKPHQVTLVPDAPSQITSNAGWDTKANLEFLTEVLDQFNSAGIRTSVLWLPTPNGGICGKSRSRPCGTLYGTVCDGLSEES